MNKLPTKKGGGGIKYHKGGEGINQHEYLVNFEQSLDITAAKACMLIGTNYSTYKCWKNGTRTMLEPILRLTAMLLRLQSTKIGKEYGV